MTKIDLFAATRETTAETPEAERPWRSIDAKENHDQTKLWLEHEFPHGLAPESFGAVTHDGQLAGPEFQRREMLKLMGASLALAGVGTGCDVLDPLRRPEDLIMPYVSQPEGIIPGVPNYFATALPGPNGAIGVVVESHEGRPTKIEGNPDHPASKGAAGIAEQSSILALYDPDRARSPMKGSTPSTWEAFDGELKSVLAGHATGAGLAIVHDGTGGPSSDRAFAAIRAKMPEAMFVRYEPLADDQAAQGSELLFGESSRVRLSLTGAKVVLAVDSNFLVEGADNLRLAREFSMGRGADLITGARDASKMNRLYVLESIFTSTGANADHRVRVASAQILSTLASLARVLIDGGAALPESLGGAAAAAQLASSLPAAKADDKFLTALAKDLRANPSAAVVIVGERQPPVVHALGHLVNALLGAFDGPTPKASVTAPVPPSPALRDRLFASLASGQPESHWSFSRPVAHKTSTEEITALVEALNGGKVSSVMLLGVNPVFTAPRALGVDAALKKAKTVIHAGVLPDETSAVAAWHVPLAHYLESWGDAVASDGTVSVIQPLVRPLFGARSALELLLVVAGEAMSARDFVKDTWTKDTALLTDEVAWRKALHQGVLPTTGRIGLSLAALGGQGGAPDEAYLGKRIGETVRASTANIGTQLGALKASEPSQSALEVVVVDCVKVGDGRRANISWAQELPDSMTKLCWDNALIMAPSLAKALDIESRVVDNAYRADVVTLTVDGRSVKLPVFVLPGLAPFTVQVTRGYGRTHAGFIGNSVGVDVGPLLDPKGSKILAGATLAKSGETTTLCSTQDHFTIESKPFQQLEVLNDGFLDKRPIYATATTAAYGADADFAKKGSLRVISQGNLVEKDYQKAKPTRPDRPVQLVDDVFPYEGQQWGMVIDLTACTGCNACVVACQAENNIPIVGRKEVLRGRELHWIRIDRYFMGDVDEPAAIHEPIACVHCENAPCEPVCPVAATVHDSDGINAMVYNRCIGTRYCANNCPLKVRRFNYFDFSKSAHLALPAVDAERNKTTDLQRNPDVTVRFRGVMEKCTYCVQRVQEAKFVAKRAGRDGKNLPDGAVTPACAQTCPTNAIVFGNINDPNARVAKMKQLDREFEILSELNIRPRTTYLARLKNSNPELG
jgi:Fe-S-cluster-containing dehydrogenase component